MSRVAVIIPARWGSTRFPGKPLHLIAGEPLLKRVWERARRARKVDAVIIATDDRRIAKAAEEFGAAVTMTSSRHVSGTDRVAEAARKAPEFTHVINAQGDEPLLDPRLIDRLAGELLSTAELEMVTAASVVEGAADAANPNIVKVVLDRRGHALYFSRSRIPFPRGSAAGPPPLRHHGIYGYSTGFLSQFVRWRPGPLELAEQLEQLRALENGAKIRVLLTKHQSIGVDVPADAVAVEKLLQAASVSARR